MQRSPVSQKCNCSLHSSMSMQAITLELFESLYPAAHVSKLGRVFSSRLDSVLIGCRFAEVLVHSYAPRVLTHIVSGSKQGGLFDSTHSSMSEKRAQSEEHSSQGRSFFVSYFILHLVAALRHLDSANLAIAMESLVCARVQLFKLIRYSHA